MGWVTESVASCLISDRNTSVHATIQGRGARLGAFPVIPLRRVTAPQSKNGAYRRTEHSGGRAAVWEFARATTGRKRSRRRFKHSGPKGEPGSTAPGVAFRFNSSRPPPYQLEAFVGSGITHFGRKSLPIDSRRKSVMQRARLVAWIEFITKTAAGLSGRNIDACRNKRSVD